jgi:hypothetical protein
MSDINWQGLRAPNIFAAYSEGQDQARQEKRQATVDAYQQERIQNERTDREAEMADRDRQARGRKGATDALAKDDYAGAQKAAIDAGDPQLLAYLKGLDAQKREELKQRNQIQGTALNSLRDPKTGQLLPDAAQRWANMKSRFLQSGWHPEELNFDPTQPGVIDAELAQAMSLDKALTLSEQARHNREMEDIGREGVSVRREVGMRPRAGRGGGGGATSLPPGY